MVSLNNLLKFRAYESPHLHPNCQANTEKFPCEFLWAGSLEHALFFIKVRKLRLTRKFGLCFLDKMLVGY